MNVMKHLIQSFFLQKLKILQTFRVASNRLISANLSGEGRGGGGGGGDGHPLLKS